MVTRDVSLAPGSLALWLQPPFDPNQPPPPCPPWNSHEGLWNEQRDQVNWSGGPPREGGGGPWSGPGGSEPGPPSWNSYEQQPPWGNQPDQPPWGQREPPFPPRIQVRGQSSRMLFSLLHPCICLFVKVQVIQLILRERSEVGLTGLVLGILKTLCKSFQ